MAHPEVIVGRIEHADMLQAMNTGHEGSLTTLHANTPRDALARLETMVLISGVDLPLQAIREQVASGIDLVIQQTRLSSGARKVTSITEVTGMENGRIQLQELFQFVKSGYDAQAQQVDGQFRGCDERADEGVPMSPTDLLIAGTAGTAGTVLGGTVLAWMALMLLAPRLRRFQLEQGLATLCQRVPTESTNLLASALRVTLETGGGLAEILERCAATIQSRQQIEAKVHALTAQGVLQAWVVGALPLLVLLVLSLVAPALMGVFWHTIPGHFALGAIGLLELGGAVVIRTIVNIDI